MRPIDRQALIDVIADAKRTDPETGSFVGWLADCLVEYLKQPNEWVSVEEKLPEPGERVLATDCGFVGEFYINERGQWQRYNVNCHALLMALDILYWMPLPAPPERRNSNENN